MVRKLTELLDQYDLRKKIIAYVKDEGTNLNAMTILYIKFTMYVCLSVRAVFGHCPDL
jgi:hypothetical protein